MWTLQGVVVAHLSSTGVTLKLLFSLKSKEYRVLVWLKGYFFRIDCE